jgi:hypothetical protein
MSKTTERTEYSKDGKNYIDKVVTTTNGNTTTEVSQTLKELPLGNYEVVSESTKTTKRS